MPRECKVCIHPLRNEIEEALRNKVPLRNIASHYGMSTGPLSRHKPHMIDDAAIMADQVNLPAISHEVHHEEEVKDLAGGDKPRPPSVGLNAYQSTLGLKAKAEKALQMAEKENDMAKMAFWFKELRSTLELIFKVGIAQKALEEKNHKDISPELEAKIKAITGGG